MKFKIYTTILLMLFFSVVEGQDKKLVVASASMIQDMAQNIAGDLVEIDLIVPIGGDPHLHKPTPRDAKLVAKADLIFINGLTFEGWINELIENSGTTAEVITVTEGVNAITNPKYNSSDPHAWMDAANGVIYAENIYKALSKLDPSNAKSFNENYIRYKKELEDLDEFIISEISKIPPQQRILVTSHDAFAYYGRKYGLQLEAIMGISTEAEAQTSDIIRVSNAISKNKIPAVFIESTVNPKLLNQIAKDNKIKIGGKLFADSIGNKDSEAPSYIEMLKHNTISIVTALSGSSFEAINVETGDKKTNLWLYIGLGLFLIVSIFFVAKTLKT